jgi:hypothetical protein
MVADGAEMSRCGEVAGLEPQRHRGTEKTRQRRTEGRKERERLFSPSFLSFLLCVSVSLWFTL